MHVCFIPYYETFCHFLFIDFSFVNNYKREWGNQLIYTELTPLTLNARLCILMASFGA